MRLLERVAERPPPMGETAATEALVQLGPEIERRERAAWREVRFRDQPERDAETATLWARWFAQDPWMIREAWEDLFLGPVMGVFRAVLAARHLPRDVQDRALTDLREAFFFLLLGDGQSPPGWAELAVRVLETSGPGPVDALAAVLDDDAWKVVARGANSRGHWPETMALMWPDRPGPAREVALHRAGLADAGVLEAGLDLHVALRVLHAWKDPERTTAERTWAVVTQNRGRARGRLRAVLMERLPPAVSESVLGLDGLHARTVAAVKRYAWSWAWQEISSDFAFDFARGVTPPCVDPGPTFLPLTEDERDNVHTWVLLVVLKGRLGHLERWVRTGGTGDRDSTWARLLSDDLSVRDPGTEGRRASTYHRVRTELADALPSILEGMRETLESVAALQPKRGLKSNFEALLSPTWHLEVPFPKSGFPTFIQNVQTELDKWADPAEDPCQP